MTMPLHSVLVANVGAPEINRLSIELERRELLRRYIRPYLNRRRWWERALERTPKAGRLYARTLGRRTPPAGLPLPRIDEAGVMADFLGAAVARAPGLSHQLRRDYAQRLVFATERAVARRTAQLLQEGDLIVASYGTGRQAFEMARRRGGRAVLSYPIAHNRFQSRLYAEEAERAPQFAGALPRLDTLPPAYTEQLEAECSLADLIIVGSSFVRRSFETLGYDVANIAVAPYGVDTQRFEPPVRPRDDGVFRVLFVGQIGQRKGMSYLLEAYRRFSAPDSELHLVGSFVTGAQEAYRDYADVYRHTPHAPQAELPSIYQQADVFVLPTLIEGMPLVVLEAMACGLPVIATHHGPADVVRDGVDGFLVPIRDVEAITARLELLYRDRALREQMGRNAREQALRHTWEDFARRAADLVEGVASTARPPTVVMHSSAR